MNSPLKIGIIGDFDPKRPSHIATNEALEHTAVELSVKVGPIWVPTHELAEEGSEITLKQFDALWCGPGSPYHMKGVLRAIHFAREQDRPFIGT